VNWKRAKNEKGNFATFGYIEYETVEGVLKCLRLLNDFNLVDKKLQIKPSTTTERYLEEWKRLKRIEWDQKN
jgi:RNA-binding protein 25